MDFSKGLKFAYGVFETLYYDGTLEYFEEHMTRLNRSLRQLHMDQVEIGPIKEEALALLSQSKHKAIRISVYNDKGNHITYETRSIKNQKSYKVCFSDIKRHSSNPLLKIKTGAHLNNFLEKQAFLEKGYDEALHFNEKGDLTEGIYTNLFFVKDGVIHTPHASCGLLEGIFRQKVIEHAKKIGIPVKIGYYNRESIQAAEEVFLTNSLIKIMPVFELDTFTYKDNIVTKQLMKEMLS